MTTKLCSKCEKQKPLSEYHVNRGKPDGLHNYCKSCWKIYRKSHYTANKTKYIDKATRWKLARRKELAELKKDLCCIKCGENHPAALDFHHTDPTYKEGSIGTVASRWSRNRLEKELEKCVVLCSNCHRKLHHDLSQVDKGQGASDSLPSW